MVDAQERHGFSWQDATGDWDHVVSDLAFENGSDTKPIATIAIPTFKRPELLVEALRSALAQTFDRPFEIAVFDNDPDSNGLDSLLAQLPELRNRTFRYWVHRENMGIFGNFNRVLLLARGEWINILMDDDLIDPDYLYTLFSELDRRRSVDGIVCQKRSIDERDRNEESRHLLHRMAVRASFNLRFLGRESRRIKAGKLFWWPGCSVGTPAGFLFRRSAALAVGGFYREEGMAADAFFYARFAASHHLRQHRANKAIVRIGYNESAKIETLKMLILGTYELHQALARNAVPRWWLRLSPLVIARLHEYIRDFWKGAISREEVEALLGIQLPPDRPWVYKATRLLLGGY